MTGLKGKMTHFELLQSYVHAYPIMTKGWRVQMLTIVVIQKCIESYKNIIDSHYINQLWFILRVILLWHSTEAVAFFTPHPRPYFSLLALSCLVSSIEETLSARLSKLKDYGFDQLVSQRNWHHLLDEKPGFWGTCLSWRDVRSRLYDGRVGEVANRVSSGSFRGGHWRYLPIRSMITGLLLIGLGFALGYRRIQKKREQLSKASQGWSSGKSGQHWDWDY